MIEGFLQGITGAAVGLAGVFLIFLVLRNFIGGAEFLKVIFPTFTFIPVLHLVAILAAGALVGFVGSFLAVRRFLQES
jgi:cell division protein FtsX